MKNFFALLACLVLLAGCESRSISDSGYRRSGHSGYTGPSYDYRGELTELDILGPASASDATETNIVKSLRSSKRPVLKRGDKLILIQSGALVPDHEMLD